MATETTMMELQRELKLRSDDGAGIAELLEQLQKHDRRFGWRRRLSADDLDQLKLYCWTLQQSKPNGMLWGRARELWGGSTSKTTVGGSRRRSQLRD